MPDECSILLSPAPVLSPPDGADYRRLARQIRDLARQTRFPIARSELLRVATNYDGRGDHLDRAHSVGNGHDRVAINAFTGSPFAPLAVHSARRINKNSVQIKKNG